MREWGGKSEETGGCGAGDGRNVASEERVMEINCNEEWEWEQLCVPVQVSSSLFTNSRDFSSALLVPEAVYHCPFEQRHLSTPLDYTSRLTWLKPVAHCEIKTEIKHRNCFSLIGIFFNTAKVFQCFNFRDVRAKHCCQWSAYFTRPHIPETEI